MFPPVLLPRWGICLAGMGLQICLGTAYAWSLFQKPLSVAYGWSNSVTAWAFCLAIGCLGLAAAWGGVQLPRLGPQRLAMLGGGLFAAGHGLAAIALWYESPALLLLGYGVVGGCGQGLAYVTPVATVARWFPDRKGLATGLVIMGFGLGALLMSKVFVPLLFALFTTLPATDPAQYAADLRHVLPRLFALLGLIFLVLTVPLGWCLRLPPTLPADTVLTSPDAGLTVRAGMASREFRYLWFIFFCNITAGIALIGFQSPLFQDLWQRVDPQLSEATLATYGASLIAFTAVCNGLGRLLWGAVSDRIGRMATFRWLLGTQVLAFLALANTANPWWFALIAGYVLLCYGGGFGTMPALVADTFGTLRMAGLYGGILTAWSAGAVVGPQTIALVKDHWPGSHLGAICFGSAAILLAMGFGGTFRLANKPGPTT
jgi:OFA family oxalate/formate antiporter-like MFS transporter